ncbi:NAD-dependent epimerase/dehydratase family protein [Lachnospiraceae bacterium ZAX-1]
MKKVLLIGGTGNISSAISEQLGASDKHEVYVLNRGSKKLAKGVNQIIADVSKGADTVKKAVEQYGPFDTVANFIAFSPDDIKRDFETFNGITKQYIFISSATVYRKPPIDWLVNEKAPLGNPFWEYADNKVKCENLLREYEEKDNFPITIVRPSHTYSKAFLPLDVTGNEGAYSVLKRIQQGKEVLLHGDGTSLWAVLFNEDFARAFIGLIGNAQAIGESVQIASERSISWNQIYQAVADACGGTFKPKYVTSQELAEKGTEYDFKGQLLGDKAYSFVFDCSKLKRLVPGYVEQIPYYEGIKIAVDHILSEKSLQMEDPEYDKFTERFL